MGLAGADLDPAHARGVANFPSIEGRDVGRMFAERPRTMFFSFDEIAKARAD
jgi:hypothetical protein